jgi:uncharacterized membrane protein YoaK (UPF0700 family)
MPATLRVLLALSFIAGFADTATFIQLYGLFSAHVTGNFVLLAAAIGKGVRENDILKLLSFPVFIFAAAAATIVHDRFHGEKPETSLDRWLAVTAGALLILGGLLALFFGRKSEANDISFADATAGMLSVAAMGVQNAVHRFAVALGPPTTVMTGTVTQLTVMATRKLLRASVLAGKAPAQAFSLQGLLWLAAAFAAGCLVSAPLTLVFGLISLIIPGILLVAAALRPEARPWTSSP